MGDITNPVNGLEAIASLANANTKRKMLKVPSADGKTNFEIIDVRAIRETAAGHNAEVRVRIDLADDSVALPINLHERFSVRTEHVRRVDLKDMAHLVGLKKNDKGAYDAEVSDLASLNAVLKSNIVEGEVTFTTVDGVVSATADPKSVGIIGVVSFGGGGPVDPEIKPNKITIDVPKTELAVGEREDITITVEPANAKDLTWTHEVDEASKAFINVQADGKAVIGKAAGTGKIKYIANGDPSITAELTILVKSEPVVEPAKIELTITEKDPKQGDVITPKVKISPEDATDKTYTLKSSDETSIKVNGTTLEVVGYNEAAITAVTNTGSVVSNEVKILPLQQNPNARYSVKIDLSDLNSTQHPDHVNTGDMINVKLSAEGLETNQELLLTSSDPNVELEFDTPIVLKPNEELSIPMIVTATAVGSFKVNIEVRHVGSKIIRMIARDFTAHNPTVKVSTVTLSNMPTVLPNTDRTGVTASLDQNASENYIPRIIEWTSNYPSNVELKDDGGGEYSNRLFRHVILDGTLPTGAEVVITCIVDGVKGESKPIRIQNPVTEATKITITEPADEVIVGGTEFCMVTTEPVDIEDSSYTVSVEPEGIVTVDNIMGFGFNVTGVAAGSCKITVNSKATPSVTDEMMLTVK